MFAMINSKIQLMLKSILISVINKTFLSISALVDRFLAVNPEMWLSYIDKDRRRIFYNLTINHMG